MAKQEKIRINPERHETKHGFMNRCRKDKAIIRKAKDTAKRSPYPLDWIIDNMCEIKYNSTHPVKTIGPPTPEEELERKKDKYKGTIFSFLS